MVDLVERRDQISRDHQVHGAFLSRRRIADNRTIRTVDDFGRYGVWVSREHWPDDAGETASAAQELESLGFGSVWIGGSPPDDLALAEALLAATSTLVVGTSIVDIWRSDGPRAGGQPRPAPGPVPRPLLPGRRLRSRAHGRGDRRSCT